MRVLGIDPGIGRVGWGVVDSDKGKQVAIAYDCFETHLRDTLEKRIQQVYEEICRLLDEYKPDSLGIEDLFFNKNVKTALIVGQARGVVLLAASQRSVPLFVYTPSQVKIAVSGYGKADKKQVGEMVKMFLKLAKVPTPDDTADALAIALTHAFSAKIRLIK